MHKKTILVLLLALLFAPTLATENNPEPLKPEPIGAEEVVEVVQNEPVVEEEPEPTPSFSYDRANWVEQCKAWAAEAGITLNSWAIELIGRESACNPNVWNYAGSGACGIPQALPCSKLPNGINTSPPEQIAWMLLYVESRYGTWENAVYFHNEMNWY